MASLNFAWESALLLAMIESHSLEATKLITSDNTCWAALSHIVEEIKVLIVLCQIIKDNYKLRECNDLAHVIASYEWLLDCIENDLLVTNLMLNEYKSLLINWKKKIVRSHQFKA